MAAPLKTQRTARFARQPSIRSTSLRSTMNRQESKRITKPKSIEFPSNNGWWLNPQGKWIKCEIVHQEDDIITIRNDLIELQVNKLEVFPFNNDIVSDMTSLRYLHEPAILYNLKQRLSNKNPYTYMGSILITVNPFFWLPEPTINEFVGKSMDPEKPHPYAIAELCSQQICVKNPKHQSVVISGESGAGKTESAKMVLNHIVNRGNYLPNNTHTDSTDNNDNNNNNNRSDSERLLTNNLSSLEERLIKTSPLLEAFGNAKTTRNSNSSRFGKYIRIYFNPLPSQTIIHPPTPVAKCSRKIAGGLIETYLLEKSRVTSHTTEERNFHVFYYLVFAKASGLIDVNISHNLLSEYTILNSSAQQNGLNSIKHRGLDRQKSYVLRENFSNQQGVTEGLEQFHEIQAALNSLNYSSTDIRSIWSIVGAILEIGNINFTEIEKPEGNISTILTLNYLQNAANLLGIDPEKLQSCLTTTVSVVRNETIQKSLNTKDSINAKNAVCKSIYSSLFQYIVSSINLSLSNNIESFEDPSYTSIGVLDIFGFESFQQNEFEQLLINYANEVLQSTFNAQVFQTELILYQSENISTTLTLDQCPNNLGCVNLLEFVLTNLEMLSERAIVSNENFFETINKEFDKKKTDNEFNKYFATIHPKDKKVEFKIKHYAETVSYHAGEKGSSSWSLKNNDKIPKELKTLLLESSDKIVRDMIFLLDFDKKTITSTTTTSTTTPSSKNPTPSSFSTDSTDSNIASRRLSTPHGNSSKKQTISSEFKNSITNLCKTLSQSNCAFIRCIKPNKALEPLTYDEKYALEQIKCLGLVQVCSVMQIGLPTRITYIELKSLLGPLLHNIEELFHNETEEVLIASLLYAFDIPSEIYQLGKTRLFFKAGQLDVLEKMLNTDYQSKQEEIIQKIKETLFERKKCEEIIKSLKNYEKECNDLVIYFNEWLKLDQLNIIEQFQNDKDNIQIKYSLINLTDISGNMSACQFSVDDVGIYGKNLSNYEDYQPIKLLIDLNIEKVSKLENMWQNMNSQLILVELFLKENILFPLTEFYRIKLDQLTKYYNELNILSHGINDVIFDSNRCLITKALTRGNELNEKLTIFKSTLEKEKETSNNELTEIKNNEELSIKQMKQLIENLLELQNDYPILCNDINESCSNIRDDIDKLRKKIIDDEERLQEEIRKAKEQEKIEREKRELEATLEYEKKEQERMSLEELEKMIFEDDYSKQREKLERFGINQQSNEKENIVEIVMNHDDHYDDNYSDCNNDNNNNNNNDNDNDDNKKVNNIENVEIKLESINLNDSNLNNESKSNNQNNNQNGNSNDNESIANQNNLRIVTHSDSQSDHKINSKISNTDTNSGTNDSFSVNGRMFTSPRQSLLLKKITFSSPLLKQSGFLKLWRHKYFALEDEILKYYKHEKDLKENNGSCKIFILSSSTVLAYTKLSLVFKVINEESNEELSLMADTKETLENWISSLKKSISKLYLQKKEFRQSIKNHGKNNSISNGNSSSSST